MKIEIRGECVHISGYVNAVGRDSRPIPSQTGKFVEMIEPGTFGKALERAENVDLLLNHNKDRKLGSTSVGNLALNEDSIGLRAEADIKDAEVVDKARSGKLRGWSFGMYVKNAQLENRAEDIPRRHVREIDLFEVSLIDDTMNPCYIGTSVECRADAEQLIETRGTEDSHHEINEIVPPDYSDYEGRINALRAMGELRAYEERLQELRYNPYHDPTNGRFTGPNGAGGGMLFVGKGQKGKGSYVVPSEIDKKIEDIDAEIERKLSSAYSYLESVQSKNTENAFHSSDEFSPTKSHWNRTENGLNSSLQFSSDVEKAKDLISRRRKLLKEKENTKKTQNTPKSETEWLNFGGGNYISKDNSLAIEYDGSNYKLIDIKTNSTLQKFKTLKQAKSTSRAFPADDEHG